MGAGALYRCPDCGNESVTPDGIRWTPVEEGGTGHPCGAKVKRLRPRGGRSGAAKVMKWGRCGVQMQLVGAAPPHQGEGR